MAWNKLLPAPSTKIRLTPAALQANWAAIETGGVPYDSLRLQGQTSAPTRVSLHGFLYASDPGAGIVELFYQDDQDPEVITQLTTDGKIGTTSTQMLTSGVSFDEDLFYDQDNFITAWARIDSAGNISGNSGISVCTQTATGKYTVKVDADRLSVNNYATFLTSGYNSSHTVINVVSGPAPAPGVTTDITVEIVKRSDGAFINSFFFIAILGGR